MTIKVIIAGGVLCAMTAAGGVGLAFLSNATSLQTQPSPILASSPQREIPAQTQTLEVAKGAADEDLLLPEDVTITFVASRTPHDVAESLAPEVSRHPLMRSGEISPAVDRRAQDFDIGPTVTRQPRAEPARATINRSPAAVVETDPEWTVGVYR